MIDQAVHPAPGHSAEAALRNALSRCDAASDTALSVLRYLAAAQDDGLFGEEILARVRGMLADLAVQMLDALVGADRLAHPDDDIAVLVQAFLDQPVMLGHVHAQALEWQLTERLHEQLALDPVAAPLVQALAVSPDAQARAEAIAFLAAQARWVQAQRRMHLPVPDMPEAVFAALFAALRPLVGIEPALADRVEAVGAQLRGAHNPAQTRRALAARLLAETGAGDTLDIAQSGVALFLHALAQRSGQPRDVVTLATHQGQIVRLALILRAVGLDQPALARQLLALHPTRNVPLGLDGLSAAQAAALLSGVARSDGGR